MTDIAFDNVSFSYDGTRNALESVSLRIAGGSFLCIIGGNGSGKSTIAKHMDALLVPTDGTVHVGELDTSRAENTFTIRQKVGLVFQNPDDQIVGSTIEEDVAFGPENLGLSTDEIRRRVGEALERVGLDGYEQRPTATLSGGEKQRVAIAGALAMKPDVLVLDEPGAMLDPLGRRMVAQLCHDLNADGLTIVLITHYMEDAVAADRIIALDEGRIALDGPPEDVLARTDELESLGLEAPFAARVSQELDKRGFGMPTCLSEGELVEALEKLMRSRTDPSPRP